MVLYCKTQRELMELRETLLQDEQKTLFKRAVDSIELVTSGMYAVGNSRNVSRYCRCSCRFHAWTSVSLASVDDADPSPRAYLQHCLRAEHSFVCA